MSETVSVICPTKNRQVLIPLIIHQFNKQIYPKKNCELIILDDSEFPCYFETNEKNIRYIYSKNQLTIGKKRNLLNSLCKNNIIINFDDDDYYSPSWILNVVNMFSKKENSDIQITGTKNMLIYDSNKTKLTVNFPFNNKNHTQNNVLCYRKSYLENNEYNNEDRCNEELFFTDNFSKKCYQFEAIDCCIHICHNRNTINKRKFIQAKYKIKNFNFMKYIDDPVFIKYIDILNKNNNSLLIICINLNAHIKRKKHMIAQFSKYNINYKFFQAINPSSIGHNYKLTLNKIIKRTTIQEICCFASHLNVMYEQLNNNYCKSNYIIISEDDIILSENIQNLYNIIENAPCDWEVLQLYHLRLTNKLNTQKNWSKWNDRSFSTALYAIKKDAAKKLVKKYIRFTKDNNEIFFDFTSCKRIIQADFFIYYGMNTYTLKFPMCKTELQFESSIQPNFEKKKIIIQSFENSY